MKRYDATDGGPLYRASRLPAQRAVIYVVSQADP